MLTSAQLPALASPVRDVEPAVWPLPAADANADAGADSSEAPRRLSEPAMVFLRSVNSNVRSRATFVNDCTEPVTMVWLDYNGQEVVYGALRPGQSKVYDSYASHPWVFRCSTTDKRMMAGGRMAHYMEPPPPGDTGLLLSSSARRQAANPEPPRVHITPPPVLQHTVSERDPGARNAVNAALTAAQPTLQAMQPLEMSSPAKKMSARKAAAAASAAVAAAAEQQAAELGQQLARLPVDLVRHIAHLAAPVR
eukprot:XP_001694179.1 predicted protein [Chlamydomonas reinhardtii]